MLKRDWRATNAIYLLGGVNNIADFMKDCYRLSSRWELSLGPLLEGMDAIRDEINVLFGGWDVDADEAAAKLAGDSRTTSALQKDMLALFKCLQAVRSYTLNLVNGEPSPEMHGRLIESHDLMQIALSRFDCGPALRTQDLAWLEGCTPRNVRRKRKVTSVQSSANLERRRRVEIDRRTYFAPRAHMPPKSTWGQEWWRRDRH